MATEQEKPVQPEAEQKKPGRGRPKDDQAPVKPKNAFQRVTGEARARIKIENPAVATDLAAMGLALKEAWDKTPESERERLTKEYEAEMEIWRPKWAAYKETDHYKKFFEIKQDWVDVKTKKKLIKSHIKGKIVVGACVRVKADLEHAYPEGQESKNYKLKNGDKGTVVAINGEGGACEIKWDSVGQKEYLKKYFGKLEDPEIPKRPKSGYMIFASENRDRAQKEVSAAGGGMGDIGKKISDYWAELSETKKAEYGEKSERMKEDFDKEFRVYKMTDKFKGFENKKVKLESTQKLKKLQRTTMSDAPKKAPNAFSLFKKGAMPKLMEENKEKGVTMSMGELGKELGKRWAAAPQSEKDALEKKASDGKAKWEAQHTNFKKHGKYMKFLEERQKVKIRENRLVNLREMPKKPKSVFALFASEHKSEVPQGKGEGKGSSALKQKFVSASEEEKARLARIAKEAEDKWRQELDEFKAGDTYKTYSTTETKVKREFMNEATKVMTLKFINAAPAAPPKSPFSVYLGEKRKAEADPEGAPKSKDAKQDEVTKFKKDWDKLDKDVKAEYEVKRKERVKAWEGEVKTFMEKEVWQEYLKEARRLKIPVKQLLSNKKQSIKKLANGMRFVALPDKPETIPQKPPNAYKLFLREKKKDLDDPEKIVSMWKEMDQAGRSKYEDEAKELQQQYEIDMKEFKSSDEGRQYFRSTSVALRSRKVIHAKFTYLKDMPKKPIGALQTYLEKNFKSQKAANPEAKGFEIRKKLTDRWLAMSAEEREPMEKEAKEKYDKYEEDMAAFKASENFKKFNRVISAKPKAKSIIKISSSKAPRPPADMPTKPTALSEFRKEKSGQSAGDLQTAFAALSDEERAQFEARAKAAEQKYQEDLAEFNKSEKGTLYQRALSSFEKKKQQDELKAKLAKAVPSMPVKPEGIPQKPPGAFKSFQKSLAGTGKDLGAMTRAWRELDAEEKEKLEEQAKEADAKYQADLEAFNKTEAGKKYKKAMEVYEKRKRLGEAKTRFLGNMPKKPALAFSFFVTANREKVARENPDIKGLGAIMGKLSQVFASLSSEEKQEYLQKQAEAQDEYEKKMKEFQASGDYKRYKAVETRVSGKPAAKAKPSGPSAPEAPADLPKKPVMPFFMFKMENRGMGPKEVHQKWMDLKAEGQQEWNKKYKEQLEQYDKDMRAFNKTAEGKKYNRLKSGFDKKIAEKRAKDRYLGGSDVPKEPKRPMSSYFLFVNAKREGVMKELGSGKFAEVSAKLTKLWTEATAEDKKEFEDQAEEAKKEYAKALAEYKNSDAVKKYEKAMGALKKKDKPKPKAASAKASAGRGGSAAKAGANSDSDGSDSDVMGSDSSNSSSSDSDSD